MRNLVIVAGLVAGYLWYRSRPAPYTGPILTNQSGYVTRFIIYMKGVAYGTHLPKEQVLMLFKSRGVKTEAQAQALPGVFRKLTNDEAKTLVAKGVPAEDL